MATVSPPRSRTTTLADAYHQVRAQSEAFCEALEIEDFVVQTMTDASPAKWHLAHVTWFFETFVLKPFAPNYRPFHADFEYMFNSYYNAVGEQFPRPRRGLIARPTVKQVFEYRRYVDEAMNEFLAGGEAGDPDRLNVVEIGLHHEQQHQELMVTDVKTVFGANPLFPTYAELPVAEVADAPELSWHAFEEGVYEIGHAEDAFAYDNEGPLHRRFVEAFALANRLVTNREYIAFIEDGGYAQAEHWLSEGWAAVNEQGWKHPMYWLRRDGVWHAQTLGGLRAIHPHEPVCHVSYFEADAFARWAKARLPREEEWEIAAAPLPIEGNFVESGRYHPSPCVTGAGLTQLYGDVWEWTQSPYTPYPGYAAQPGALGEYNGKFMCNQYVLRGGSCATSLGHIRPTYRNFFPAPSRWQFSGFRLARDIRG